MTARDELLAALTAERFTPIPAHRVLPPARTPARFAADVHARRVQLADVLQQVEQARAVPCPDCDAITPAGRGPLAREHRPTCPRVIEDLVMGNREPA